MFCELTAKIIENKDISKKRNKQLQPRSHPNPYTTITEKLQAMLYYVLLCSSDLKKKNFFFKWIKWNEIKL